MTELEKSIYSAIDVLQKQIANDKKAISDLLNKLTCKYIITRTFIKDWSCHRASCSEGFKMYYSGNTNGFDYDQKNCYFFKSLRDAETYLKYCKQIETLKDYVEIKIERVDK